MSWNLTCNSTLEDLRIGSEQKIAGNLTFHELALIIAGAGAAISILTSFYLMWRHATNYTKPREQKHIIRILFMIPVYATSAFLCIWYYWHAVYFQVISDCYEAFAISSFFALMCHYMAPDLHDQKEFFRSMQPVKRWVWPLNWMAKCCGGDRGAWRTPKSGLTWFNIVWIGIYHYCFIRVAMTITAVVTQYFERYCESSNSPVFAHIWVIVIECIAVSIAMYCVIQFYVQLREPLTEHRPFLKVLAIKLVIFLSFWQTVTISIGTSTLNIVKPNEILSYPDLKIGIPSLLLCVEMAFFSILHLWAFPYAPYVPGAKPTYYPPIDPSLGLPPRENEHGAPQGGFMGLKAFLDALNIWDVVKAFGRGIRWLFVGVKHRHTDASYRPPKAGHTSTDSSYPMTAYGMGQGRKSTDHLPIASEFRRSTFGMPGQSPSPSPGLRGPGGRGEENAGLIQNAQPSPGLQPENGGRVPSPYHDPNRGEYYQSGSTPYDTPAIYTTPASPDHRGTPGPTDQRIPRDATQTQVGNALWGDRDLTGRSGQ